MIDARTTGQTGQFVIQPRGTYSLAAAKAFWERFTPAAYDAGETGKVFDLAFLADDREHAAGVRLTQRAGVIAGEVSGPVPVAAVQAQAARILSLDVDGSGFASIGERDPVIGRLQARFAGLRPVCFASPYEAAAWAIIGNRIRIVQAARIKQRLADEYGPSVTVGDRSRTVFPGPHMLRELGSFPGLSARKIDYLRHLAEAAMTGALDATRLRSLPPAEALRELKTLLGIGDFGAELILLRGAGAVDLLPTAEARLPRAVAHAYGLSTAPTSAAIETLAEAWRPYRTWVVLLLRTALEADTHEIAGRGSRPPA